jgi:CheY-like chemotaxis protein
VDGENTPRVLAYFLLTLTDIAEWRTYFLKLQKQRRYLSRMTMASSTLKSCLGVVPILVAESEPVARSSLSELFRISGHSVQEAPDSNSAITQINENSGLKVIMLDLEMPSWRSVVTHAQGTLPAAIILGMSGQDSSRAVLEARGLGVHAYLLKPLVFDGVCEAILRLMTGQSLG